MICNAMWKTHHTVLLQHGTVRSVPKGKACVWLRKKRGKEHLTKSREEPRATTSCHEIATRLLLSVDITAVNLTLRPKRPKHHKVHNAAEIPKTLLQPTNQQKQAAMKSSGKYNREMFLLHLKCRSLHIICTRHCLSLAFPDRPPLSPFITELQISIYCTNQMGAVVNWLLLSAVLGEEAWDLPMNLGSRERNTTHMASA
jgi:hypothetical protein